MKKIFVIAVMLMTTVFSSFAAFPIRHTNAASIKNVPIKNSEPFLSVKTVDAAAHLTLREKVNLGFRVVKNHFNSRPKADYSSKPGNGWPGIVSLFCGVAMVISFVVAALMGPVLFVSIFFLSTIAAFVLGIIGLGRRYSNHGLAIAGLVLGSLGIILIALVIALISALAG